MRECIRLKPDFYPPYINLGRLLEDAGQLGTAVTQWLALVNSLPTVNGDAVKHKLMALQQMGRVLESVNQDSAAEDALKQALDINSAQSRGHPALDRVAAAAMQVAGQFEGWEYVEAKTLMAGISPLSLANLADDPMFQLAQGLSICQGHDRDSQARRQLRPPGGGTAGRGKLRIGYVSSDLREHAVGFAMTDVFETHDREHFEIYAYYCGIKRTDPTQARIKNSVDHWLDINGLTDRAGRPEDRRGPDRHPRSISTATPRMRAPRCSRCGPRPSS